MTRTIFAIALTGLAIAAAPAGAATLTFDSLTPDQVAASTYVEDGFTVTSRDGVFWGYPTGGQLHFDPDLDNRIYDLTFSGGLFTFSSVDIVFTSPGAQVRVAAFDLNDELIAPRITFNVSSLGTLTNPFPSVQIARLRFTALGDHFSIDNLVANGAVPEPATWAMMIGGMGAAGGALRRRRDVSVRFA